MMDYYELKVRSILDIKHTSKDAKVRQLVEVIREAHSYGYSSAQVAIRAALGIET